MIERFQRGLIPEGCYCYTFLGVEKREVNCAEKYKGTPWEKWGTIMMDCMRTELCPYFIHDEEDNNSGYCKLFEDEPDHYIMDQCKICGINEEEDEELEEMFDEI